MQFHFLAAKLHVTPLRVVTRTIVSQVCICVDSDNFVLCRGGRETQLKLRKKIYSQKCFFITVFRDLC